MISQYIIITEFSSKLNLDYINESMILQLPGLVGTVGMVLTPDLHPNPGVHVAVGDVEDEVVALTPQVFPLQPPLLVNPTMMIPAQHSGSGLIAASFQVHGQPRLK